MKKIISIALILVLIFSVAATAAFAEKKEVLVFGTSADYAPFEFMYPDENGKMVFGGIDIMVAQYVADYLGMELQIENMDFGYLLTALNKGDFDIVLADIEPTEKRLKAADFSDSYMDELPEYILVRTEDADKFQDHATDSRSFSTAPSRSPMTSSMISSPSPKRPARSSRSPTASRWPWPRATRRACWTASMKPLHS